MKHCIIAVCAAAVLACGAPSVASAQTAVSNAATVDNKSDAWAWITGYGRWGDILGEPFCVPPGRSVTYGFTGYYVYEVRAEVTHAGCAHPVYYDQRRGYPYGQNAVKYTYYIHGTDGKYWYDEKP